MTITSYAQNFEDVILLRALKHVPHGFYIDVGAQDPVGDSVSLAFYELGWRGVHIEPTPHYARRIREARPDEEVIEAAIARQEGTISFFEFSDTGLSTGDAEIARQHEASGYSVRKMEVPTLPLSQILSAYEGREIHWLKIDVEGMEEQVIESWSPSSARPWIVLVESTKPNSPEPSFEAWEPKLLSLGYEFVYFDGLNRFYVDVDHPELKVHFGPGPNYFDRFVLTERSPFCSKLAAEISGLHAEFAKLHEASRVRAEEAAEAQRALTATQSEIARLQSSLETMRVEATSQRLAQAQAAIALKAEFAVLTHENTLLVDQLASRTSQISDLTAEIALTREKLDAIRRSTSWKITSPLRSLIGGLRRLRARDQAQTIHGKSRQGGKASSKIAEERRGDPQMPHVQPAHQTFPNLENYPQVAVGDMKDSHGRARSADEESSKLIVIDQLDTSAESETVQRLYRQLTLARKYILRSTGS